MKVNRILLAGLLTMQAPLAFSAPTDPVAGNPTTAQQIETMTKNLPIPQLTPVTGLGGGSTFIGNAGGYDFNTVTQDSTRLALELLEQQKLNQQLDRDYIKDLVARLSGHLKALADLKVKFQALSFNSSSSAVINIEGYLTLVNEIANADQLLRNEMATAKALTRESLPSYEPLKLGELSIQASTSGQVVPDAVLKNIDATRVDILNQMNAMKFPNMQTQLGQPFAVKENALTPNLTGLRVLGSKEIEEKVELIGLKLTLDKKTRDYNNHYVEVAVNLINGFITNYGTSDWLRWRNNNDKAARELAFTAITDAFMRRSYIRKIYGIRLGAIQSMDYDKKLANTEDLTYQPMLTAAKSLRKVAATTQADVARAFENARNFVELYDKKLTPVFKSRDDIMRDISKFDFDLNKLKEFASDNTGIMVRANSAINTITGQDAPAEALLMIMRLVLADATEEMLLYGDATEDLSNYHNSKYRVNAEAKKAYMAKVCKMDPYLSEAVVKQLCNNRRATPPENTGGRSIQEQFYGLILQINTVEKGKRQEAAFAQELVAMALRAAEPVLTDEEQAEQDAQDLEQFN